MKKERLIHSVSQTIQKHQLLRKGDKVLVAVSGGADSVCLLHLLVSIRHALGIDLIAAHVNHGLRAGALPDERFVRQLCDKWAVSLKTKTIKWGRTVNLKTVSEERARDRRYQALVQIARSAQTDIVALGHHQNDLAETVLMRIIRGTGSKGLVAMTPKREVSGLTIIRPLLNASREEIEQYLSKNKLPHRQDPTNRQTTFLRNRIRHELIPLLQKKYNPNIVDVLSRLSQSTTGDYELLENMAHDAYDDALTSASVKGTVKLKISSLRSYPQALRRMVLRLAVEQVKGNLRLLTARHIDEMEDLLAKRPVHAIAHLPNALFAQKKSAHLLIRTAKKP